MVLIMPNFTRKARTKKRIFFSVRKQGKSIYHRRISYFYLSKVDITYNKRLYATFPLSGIQSGSRQQAKADYVRATSEGRKAQRVISAYTRRKEKRKPVTQASVCLKGRTYKEESKDRPQGESVKLPNGSRVAMPS